MVITNKENEFIKHFLSDAQKNQHTGMEFKLTLRDFSDWITKQSITFYSEDYLPVVTNLLANLCVEIKISDHHSNKARDLANNLYLFSQELNDVQERWSIAFESKLKDDYLSQIRQRQGRLIDTLRTFEDSFSWRGFQPWIEKILGNSNVAGDSGNRQIDFTSETEKQHLGRQSNQIGVETINATSPERGLKFPQALILTALRLEFEAVCSFLEDQRDEMHPKGTIYRRGIFKGYGQTWEVIVVETGAGNNEAAMETERAINRFDPIAVFFVGIAGGIKDVKIGDVVVASKIYGYESGAAKKFFQPRADVGESSYLLVQRAQAESRRNDWLARISNITTTPKTFIGAIAAGEKVVKSKRSDVYKFLESNYSDALAVEMEGRGFLNAARANFVHALVVRGISDLIDKKAQADASGSQDIAAKHAGAFTFEILAKLQPGIQRIGSGLNRIDEFRKVTLEAFGRQNNLPSVEVKQIDESLQIEERGVVREVIQEQDLKLSELDIVRDQALDKRIKVNWMVYNELYGDLPTLKSDKRIIAQQRMEGIKSELCKDFREKIKIYERALGVSLQDHYSLYEVCDIKFTI